MILELTSLFLGMVIVAIPIVSIKYPPKGPNSFYGYRTAKTFRNMDAWKSANHYWPRITLKLSWITIVIQLISLVLFGVIASIFITSSLWVFSLILSVILTENKLRSLNL